MARKPLDRWWKIKDDGKKVFGKVMTIAENVLKWGTGGLNIDASRVGTETITQTRTQMKTWREKEGRTDIPESADNSQTQTQGRFPANFLHDGSDEVVGLFPDTKSGKFKRGVARERIGFRHHYQGNGSIKIGESNSPDNYGDSGSASRFFYCAKASKRDRNEGLEGFEDVEMGRNQSSLDGGKMLTGSGNERSNVKQNFHPCVKPTSLMQYLVRLVTPKGGTVLDPFMGSGSTGKACKLE